MTSRPQLTATAAAPGDKSGIGHPIDPTLATVLPAVSIIVPTFNEADCLKTVFGELFEYVFGPDAPAPCEIVIVDDGSTDCSAELIDTIVAGRDHVLTTRHARNLGMGAAFVTGLKRSQGRFVYLHPADGSFDIRDLSACMALIGEKNMVIGRRTGYRATHSIWRSGLSEMQSIIFSAVLGLELRDFCGVNLMPAAPLKRNLPRSRSYVATIEAAVILKRLGWTAVDQSIVIQPRVAGRSKVLRPFSLVRAMRDMAFLAARSWLRRNSMPPSSMPD